MRISVISSHFLNPYVVICGFEYYVIKSYYWNNQGKILFERCLWRTDIFEILSFLQRHYASSMSVYCKHFWPNVFLAQTWNVFVAQTKYKNMSAEQRHSNSLSIPVLTVLQYQSLNHNLRHCNRSSRCQV